jgi:hypothetical protein
VTNPHAKVYSPTSVPDGEQTFVAARELLTKLIGLSEARQALDPEVPPNTRMVYTNGVTLWMLILQRLGNGQSLSEIVSQVINNERDLLPDNKRVREDTLSDSTAAYSKARKRLPLDFIETFSQLVCDYLGQISPPVFDGRRVFILDGTTITLPPTPALKKAFPPATNQHGTSVWPVAMLMIANELQSGCALLPQIDPMYGEHNSSEARQAAAILGQLPAKSVVLADAGFGIFSVAYASIQAGQDFLFRLSASRFKALRRKAELFEEGSDYKTYRLKWTPSDKDRHTNPNLPRTAAVEVLVHEVTLKNGRPLYLVSSLEAEASSVAELYSYRYDVEFDIRDLKVTMDTENISAKSVEMVRKELMTSVVAYNLVTQFRRQAADLVQLKPRRLSFKGVWTTFRSALLLKEPRSYDEWQALYARALVRAGKRKHPQRKAPRDYPRQAHPRRPKSTKFQKSQRQTAAVKSLTTAPHSTAAPALE